MQKQHILRNGGFSGLKSLKGLLIKWMIADGFLLLKKRNKKNEEDAFWRGGKVLLAET